MSLKAVGLAAGAGCKEQAKKNNIMEKNVSERVAGVMAVIGKKGKMLLRQLLRRLGRVTLTQIKCRIRNTAVTSNFPDTPVSATSLAVLAQETREKTAKLPF